jgi:hypothetical protein
VKRQLEQDLAVLHGALGPLSEAQLQIFFVIHTFIARHKPSGLPLVDVDVAEATGALATSFESATRGVLFEQHAATPGAEALRRELKGFLASMAEQSGAGGSRFEREVAVVLRGIERGAKHDSPGIGAGAVAYLTLVARILHERPPDARQAESRLILP